MDGDRILGFAGFAVDAGDHGLGSDCNDRRATLHRAREPF
jgi:hypothetical protein